MKKDYSTKKKAAIAALSIVAVCLAGGLFYYTSTMGGQPQETPVESTAPVESQVVVPEIKPEATPKTVQTDSSTTDAAPSENPADTSQETAAPTGSETQDTTQSKPSDGKPKSPSEAVAPSSPPAETNQGSGNGSNSTPEQTQPQGGEKRSDGAIYVPGFGWVEDSGEENKTNDAPNAGTGEPVGDM